MAEFNRGDTHNPHNYRQRAQRLRDEATNELDPEKRHRLLMLAADLDQQARQMSRPRG
jgi:hypothetical protein